MKELEHDSESINQLTEYLGRSFDKWIDVFEDYLHDGIVKKERKRKVIDSL